MARDRSVFPRKALVKMKLASFLAPLASLGDQFIIKFYFCACCPGRQSHLSEQPGCRRQQRAWWGGGAALLPTDRKDCDRHLRPPRGRDLDPGERTSAFALHPQLPRAASLPPGAVHLGKHFLKACHQRKKSDDVSVCSYPSLGQGPPSLHLSPFCLDLLLASNGII